MTDGIEAKDLIEKSSVEQTGPITKKVSVTIFAEKVKEKLDSQYRELKKSVAMRGFRKGKAPLDMIKRHYGPQVDVDVKSSLLGSVLKDLVETHDIRMVAEPQIEKADIADDKRLEAEIIFEVKPELEVKDYKGFSLEREPLNVLDAAIEQRLESIREQHAVMEPVQEARAAENGDIAEIDYEGKLDGVPFPGGKDQGHDLELGGGKFIPGFEDGVIGMKAGETKEIPITFPEDYQADHLAGKDALFTVTVNALKQKTLPALDDDFAKDLGGQFKAIDEVEARIHKDIEMGEKNRIRRNERKNIIDALLLNNDLEVPPTVVKNQIKAMKENMAFQLRMSGLSDDQINDMVKGSDDRYEEEAGREVKAAYIFDAIAEKEEIEVTDEDLEKRFEKIAEDTDRNVDQVKGVYQKDDSKSRLKEEILEDMVLDFLIDNADVTWEDPVGKGSATEVEDKEKSEDKGEDDSE